MYLELIVWRMTIVLILIRIRIRISISIIIIMICAEFVTEFFGVSWHHELAVVVAVLAGSIG
jgi:hypothetical protein